MDLYEKRGKDGERKFTRDLDFPSFGLWASRWTVLPNV